MNGTPADCVHIALTGLLGYRPDLVVSGINNGANMGDDTIYSGTVGRPWRAICSVFRPSPVPGGQGMGDLEADPAPRRARWWRRCIAHPSGGSPLAAQCQHPQHAPGGAAPCACCRLGRRHAKRSSCRGKPAGRNHVLDRRRRVPPTMPKARTHATARAMCPSRPSRLDLTDHDGNLGYWAQTAASWRQGRGA